VKIMHRNKYIICKIIILKSVLVSRLYFKTEPFEGRNIGSPVVSIISHVS
jgi:hypothetical protein